MRKAGLYIIITLLAQLCWSQQSCKEVVEEHFNDMRAIKSPEGDDIYFFEYQVESIYHYSYGSEENREHARLWMKKGHMIYESERMSIYKDEEDMFVVIHPEKQVIWSPGTINTDRQLSIMQSLQMEKLFLSQSRVRTCGYATTKEGSLRTIDLELDEHLTKEYGLKYATYYYDERACKMDKIVYSYRTNRAVIRQVYQLFEADYDHADWQHTAAKEKILSKTGMLRPQYRGYTLINNKI